MIEQKNLKLKTEHSCRSRSILPFIELNTEQTTCRSYIIGEFGTVQKLQPSNGTESVKRLEKGGGCKEDSARTSAPSRSDCFRCLTQNENYEPRINSGASNYTPIILTRNGTSPIISKPVSSYIGNLKNGINDSANAFTSNATSGNSITV
jgi:hypothetical protein